MDGASQCEGGSDDDSSSYPPVNVDSSRGNDASDSDSESEGVEYMLDDFRQNWKDELRRSKSPAGGNSEKDGVKENETIEQKARRFFLRGAHEERVGNFQNAVQFYRVAIQLVPDIEEKLAEEERSSQENRNRHERVRLESESSVMSVDSTVESLLPELEMDDEEDADIENLPVRFQRLKVMQQGVCQPQYEQSGMHISDLPGELLVHIMKWIISSELDLHALEILTQVCRGFYLLARDEGIWRLACVRVWGRKCGRPSQFGSWRNMYIERPRPNLAGCYISRMSYLRYGEKGFDNSYKPVFIIEYYRCMRFYADGTFVMVTSNEVPNVIVSKLRSHRPVMPGLFVGRYQIIGNQVTAKMKRQVPNNRNKRSATNIEQTFLLELIVCGKKNKRLKWQHFSVQTLKKSCNYTSSCEFELTHQSYPALHFARVKSYTTGSETMLQ